jgi:hypothetical protein
MTAGRPPKYDTPEQMQAAIDQYFATDAYIEIGEGKMYAPTVEGLAFALNLSRQGLCEYGDKDAFSDTIKRAKQRIAIALEQRLYGQAVTGAIFNLKNNFGWKDKTEQEVTGANGGPLGILLKEISGNTLGPKL